MSENIVWDSSFAVGNEGLDNQHKQLFKLINSLKADFTEQQTRKIIMELYKYTRRHFSAEEKLMRQIGYPGYAEHIILHDDLITQLNELSRQELKSKKAVYDLHKFLIKWLTEHILHQDLNYSKYLKADQAS